ncbi:MAG: vitamin K epoxide reductase family protein [Anaerolineales bacterium]|nr:vitamin K epoxide reductase family protein [Anaerolineales bacterium]
MSVKSRASLASATWLDTLLKDRLRAASLVLTILGLGNAGYLAWTKLTVTSIYCGPGSSACDAVSASTYGYLLGIPVSYLGFAAYVVMFALLALETQHPLLKSAGPLAGFGLALFGTLFSAYLQYTSIVILREICPYCVVNALTQLALLILAILRLRQSLAADPE